MVWQVWEEAAGSHAGHPQRSHQLLQVRIQHAWKKRIVIEVLVLLSKE
jgi:hypothetical protein